MTLHDRIEHAAIAAEAAGVALIVGGILIARARTAFAPAGSRYQRYRRWTASSCSDSSCSSVRS